MVYFLEYIWIDKGGIPRSKIKTCDGMLPDEYDLSYARFPKWNFDGSSTGQNWLCPSDKDTEVVLKPVRAYISPLDPDTVLVLCQLDLEYENEAAILTGPPIPGFNTRSWASRISRQFADQGAWFGAEQEYSVLDAITNLPYNWTKYGEEQQGKFYCSVAYPHCQLNEMAREHLQMCAKMGIKISGINAEVAPSQWEFQIGPAELLKVADDLVMARYLLLRLSTKYQVKITFHPKPMKGNWNGSGCHLNFSTYAMRTPQRPPPTNLPEGQAVPPTPMEIIYRAIDNLGKDHPNILKFYGEDNHERLTGHHETSSMDKFSYGVGTRHTSVRIPNLVAQQSYGYIEDRRPASNMDPYLAMGKLLLTTQTGNSTD
jgi:glutamine synthetase